MANAADGGLTDTSSGGNPYDVGSSYDPSQDPNAGYVNTDSGSQGTPWSGGNPSDVGSSYDPSQDPNAGYVNTNPGQTVTYGQTQTTGGNSPGGNVPPSQRPYTNAMTNMGYGTPPASGTDWLSLLKAMGPDPAYAQQSQQYLDWYTKTQFPAELALQQQLQGAQIGLGQNQNDMQNALATSGLTGQYGGAPTLQAQALMAQYGLASSAQDLAARGQDATFAQGLEGLAANTGSQDVQMAGIQAQLAQSPLVAWYTARGLPPPQSAIMNAQAPNLQQQLQTLGMAGGMQSIPGFNGYQQNWQFANQGPPVPALNPGGYTGGFGTGTTAGTGSNPGGMTAAPQGAYPAAPADTQAMLASPQYQQFAQAYPQVAQMMAQMPPPPAAPASGDMSGGTGAMNPMSQGAPPWAQAMANGQAQPTFSGSNLGMPSTQEWASATPQEQQAMMSVAQSMTGMDPNTFYQQMYAQSPQFGGYAQPGTYQSY